jgi:hypothetical protein
MEKYEQAYGRDWDTLDRDDAVERAYALGVAASLGEYHPDELDAIRDEVDTSYEKSVVELAFDEGKTEAKELKDRADGSDPVWGELVEGETVTVEPEEMPTGGRDGLPAAIDMSDFLERPDQDSTEPVERPDFLDRD